jgi:hypothetical protein
MTTPDPRLYVPAWLPETAALIEAMEYDDIPVADLVELLSWRQPERQYWNW